MVKVRLYGSLRAIVGRDEIDLRSTKLCELLSLLRETYTELAKFIDTEDFVVLVNEKPVPKSELSMELSEEDLVDILPVVSGGL